MFTSLSKSNAKYDRNQLYPRIIAKFSENVGSDESPVVLEGDNVLVEHSLIDGVSVHVVYQESETHRHYVTHNDLTQWSIDQEKLFTEAFDNLSQTFVEATKLRKYKGEEGEGDLYLVEGAEEFSSCMLLSEAFWSGFNIDPCDVAAIIPHWNTLFFTSDKSQKSIAKLSALVPSYFDDPEMIPNRLITECVLVMDCGPRRKWIATSIPTTSTH